MRICHLFENWNFSSEFRIITTGKNLLYSVTKYRFTLKPSVIHARHVPLSFDILEAIYFKFHVFQVLHSPVNSPS